jgi:hypothetical protein
MFKNIRQLWNSRANNCVPLDEAEAFHKVNCLDAHAIEEWNRISPINVKESCDHTADVDANFNETFHPRDFTKTFDGSLQKFAMCLNKIEFTLIFLCCSTSQCALSLAKSSWPTKLKMVIKLVSNFRESRGVC